MEMILCLDFVRENDDGGAKCKCRLDFVKAKQGF